MRHFLGLVCVFLWTTSILAAPPSDQPLDILVPDDAGEVPPDLTLRARVIAITPSEPSDIAWRQGGEGLGGLVTRGVLGAKVPVGQWTEPVPVASFSPGKAFPKLFFLTITVGNGGRPKRPDSGERNVEGKASGASRDVRVEFEFAYKGEVVKQFTEEGPDGGTFGLVIPVGRLGGGTSPKSPEFLDELSGVLAYARRRAERLEALPWAKLPLPKKVAIVTDLGGYGEGTYYGVRTSDKAVIAAECRSLRQIGINGLRNAPGFLLDQVAAGEAQAKDFGRIRLNHGMGFPVPRFDAKNPAKSDPESGCPFAPGVAARTQAGIEKTLADAFDEAADEVWALTVDEIGAVFDAAPEGKNHVATCPRCAEGFREYLKSRGLKPGDFGKADWTEITPVAVADPAAPPPTDRAAALRTYYTGLFINYASAKLFTPLRDAAAKANEEKQKAIAAGDTASAAAKRPFLYSYALRGNTFLMGGHSLDFFEFYRHADNAFVYETSNRDPRVWHWDSHLCDVGRVVAAEQGLEFGIYVKPHRGAPIQRAISSLARGATMLYWYTYGPDWAKGDTFAADEESLVAASKGARLIAAAEDVLYGSKWAAPAEVAIVSPRSSEFWMRRLGNPPDRVAAWENAKWIYTALTHAHLPVDALDEDLLVEKSLADLGRYKVLYINGPNLTAAAAKKIEQWVAAGGTLVTHAGGMRLDEANQPLAGATKLVGLTTRREPEMWKKVKLYGATSLESFDDKSVAIAPAPTDLAVRGGAAFGGGNFSPIVGREILAPGDDTEILARFSDGGPAVTRHAHGKGTAWVVGLFPGLEYSAPLRTDRYDLRRDHDPIRVQFAIAPCKDVVRPVVDCNQPTVEGVLVKNAVSGQQAVALMNWTYRIGAIRTTSKGGRTPVPAFVPLEKVKVTIRTPDPIARVRLALGGEVLSIERSEGAISVTLPRLEEAAVLLLE